MPSQPNQALDPQPVILTGNLVRLEPLTIEHAEGVYVAAADEAIWRYLPRPGFSNLLDAEGWISEALAGQEKGQQVSFAVVDRETDQVAGSTAFLDIDRNHRTLEIGWTWYGTPWQRTGVNTECKYLLMRHAFEDLSARRVSLKTDHRNARSRQAILRLGAVEEGTWRNHRIAWDGEDRHSVFFSVIVSEWPDVKSRLESLMRR